MATKVALILTQANKKIVSQASKRHMIISTISYLMGQTH